MISARWTRSVRVNRKKTGLDFSIKGGKEHGIGVFVSWIKGGAAASSLHLGDEILAVNNRSVQGLTHTQTVDLLKGAGSTITLLVRPNQTLEDIFACSSRSPPASLLTSSVTGLSPYSAQRMREQQLLPPAMDAANDSPPSPSLRGSAKPLPPGWSQKLDHKTGQAYFENHYTCTSSWCDPRSRTPVPLEEFEWNTLPPGWERFLDPQGDIYYVNHHTQSTHWDSPWGSRHQHLQKQLAVFLKEHRDKVQVEDEELARKRKLLLEKNHQLSLVSVSGSRGAHQNKEEKNEGSSDDLIEDMMLLNEEVEAKEEEMTGVRRHLRSLMAILHSARADDLGEKDEHREAADLAVKLSGRMATYYQLVRELVALVESIDQSRRTEEPDTPLHSMLQLPVPMELCELEEKQSYLHVLPDRLTAKTTSELRLDLAMLEEMLLLGEGLHKRLQLLHSQVLAQFSSSSLNGWEHLIEQLASLDFRSLQENCIVKYSFKKKLDKLLTF